MHNFLFTALLLALGLFLGMLLSLEIGYRIGMRRIAKNPKDTRPVVGTVEGAIFALLDLRQSFQ